LATASGHPRLSHNRRAFLKAAATAAACAVLNRDPRANSRAAQTGFEPSGIEPFGAAAGFAASGRLGRVPLIEARAYGGWAGGAATPVRLDCRSLHALDLGLRAIQLTRRIEDAHRLPVRVSAVSKRADEVTVHYDFGDTLLNFELINMSATSAAGFQAVYYGTEGTLLVSDRHWEIHRSDGRTEMAGNTRGSAYEARFLDCLRRRQHPDCDTETARVRALLCRLGAISYRLDREVRFDAETETFPGDAAANALLSA